MKKFLLKNEHEDDNGRVGGPLFNEKGYPIVDHWVWEEDARDIADAQCAKVEII